MASADDFPNIAALNVHGFVVGREGYFRYRLGRSAVIDCRWGPHLYPRRRSACCRASFYSPFVRAAPDSRRPLRLNSAFSP